MKHLHLAHRVSHLFSKGGGRRGTNNPGGRTAPPASTATKPAKQRTRKEVEKLTPRGISTILKRDHGIDLKQFGVDPKQVARPKLNEFLMKAQTGIFEKNQTFRQTSIDILKK